MTSSTGDLQTWRRRFVDEDSCPWPGPRPLDEGDQALLIGRGDDRKDFRRTIQQHRLVLLHGSSGVGKTSFLRAGVVPDLERSRWRPFVASQWGGTRELEPERFLADKLGIPASNSSDIFESLVRSARGEIVLVLDQFEELVRYSPSTTLQMFDLILELNRRFSFKIVISFRSEYLHEFSDLEAGAVNFTVAQFPLKELQDNAALKVILAGNRKVPDSVDTQAADFLADGWIKSRVAARREVAYDDPFRRVGLLHLQAMLYVLFFANDKRPLDLAAAREIVGRDRAAVELPGDDLDPGSFQLALQRSIDFKLDHCVAASTSLADNYLINGTRWMLARVVRHLSSAGYKLIRGAQELARLALGVDYDTLAEAISEGHLGIRAETERALFDALLVSAKIGERPEVVASGQDLLSTSPEELALAADETLPASGREWYRRVEKTDLPSWDRDPLGVTCGPMMGLSPAEVLIEEFRRFAFALVWLEMSALVRVSTPMGASPIVSLVHDGFGPALLKWSETVGRDPEGPLSAITAPRGASLRWSDGAATRGHPRDPVVSGRASELAYRRLPNLCWRGGRLQADLEWVAFLNCDFRGTLFDGCRMTGVTFVNCLLDSAIFSDCIFSGAQADAAPDEAWSESEPDFLVPAPQWQVSSHAFLRRFTETKGSHFLCDLPGAPAVPYRGEQATTVVRYPGRRSPDKVCRLEARLDSGGMAVYGGRISSFVVRRCYLEDGSGISLRHTTGSGLEVVEIADSPGRFEIYGSAIRHISLSPELNSDEAARVTVRARESALAQIWIGPRLRGSFTVEGSRLLHAWNGSPADANGDGGVRFVAADCVVHGLIDVDAGDSGTAGLGVQLQRIEDLGLPGIADQLHRMDYRRNPAQSHQAEKR